MNNPDKSPFIPVAVGFRYPGPQVPHYYCPVCQGCVVEQLPEDGHCVRCQTKIGESL